MFLELFCLCYTIDKYNITVLVRTMSSLQRGASQRGLLAAAAAARAAAQALQRRHGEDHPPRTHAPHHALLLRALRQEAARPTSYAQVNLLK